MPETPMPARTPRTPRRRVQASRQATQVYNRRRTNTNMIYPSRYDAVRHSMTYDPSNIRVFDTPQLRQLANIPPMALCQSTLVHQMSSLKWRIVNEDGQFDDITRYYGMLFHAANDYDGGMEQLIMRLVTDILSCKEGAFIEIARNADGVPIGVYNIVDASTMVPTDDIEQPWMQKIGDVEVKFRVEDIIQLRWLPFPQLAYHRLNLTPVQIAYWDAILLASTDDYYRRIVSEIFPAGLLNLGMGFDRLKALEWRDHWEETMSVPTPNKLALLWGTDRIDYKPFAMGPEDTKYLEAVMMFTSRVTSAYELSILDINLGISRVSTSTAAETLMQTSRRTGMSTLVRAVIKAFERMILPEGYSFRYDAYDKEDEKNTAATAQMRTQSIATLVNALGPDAGLEEARAQGVFLSPRSLDKTVIDHFEKQGAGRTTPDGPQTPEPSNASGDDVAQDVSPTAREGQPK